MSWLASFKLGPIGYELPITARIMALGFDFRHVEAMQRNILGGLRRSLLRVNVPIITLQAGAMSMDTMAKLQGLHSSQSVLNFKSNTAFKVLYQLCISTDTLTVILPATSASGITITGVFLKSDVNKSGTNYFTSGSYDATTRTVTLGTDLPDANAEVWVDYSFTGHSVLVTRYSPAPHQGQYQDLWQAGIELTGA